MSPALEAIVYTACAGESFRERQWPTPISLLEYVKHPHFLIDLNFERMIGVPYQCLSFRDTYHDLPDVKAVLKL